MTSTILTIRIPIDVSDRLSRLADATNRSRSSIAKTAVTAYVDHELAIVEGIRCGLVDVAAGRTSSHDEVTAEAEAMICALQDALILGEQSGAPRPLDFEALKARKRKEWQAR